MRLEFLKAVFFGLVGLATWTVVELASGRRFDLLRTVVAGGIGLAIYVATQLGKYKGIREAEFGPEHRYDDNG